jgi:transposase InsO family protein
MIEYIRQATGCTIRRICVTLEVPRSSYYHAAEPTPTQLSDQQIGEVIEEIFKRHRRRYGYRRIWEELSDQSIVCAADRVRRIMKERGLRAIQPKTYVPKTSDGRADKPSPNLLLDQPLPTQPDQVWAGDITFIPASGRWLYLAVIIDLYSRKIVGWALADHLRSELVIDALQQALGSRSKDQKPIFHSDRGSQYGSTAYRQLLSQAGMRQSMSARANPYHNAWTESFMGTLKSEMLQDGCFLNDNDARTEIFAYIESYYNTHRKHSSLGYKTPAQFETLN